MYAVITLTLLLCSTLLNHAHGAVTITLGQCPDNHKAGDYWIADGCIAFACHKDSYTQMSCGLIHVGYDPTKCYLHHDKTAKYPSCCRPVLKCIGDIGFDPNILVG